ncbi:DinB family protein [Micromonospora sp. GCM10011542]|uniref:DinB family protein n=1 Tax=Micromonospora sp. GCM10011542 TaxID=3317337 RepID=UPI00361F929C
MTWTAPEVSRPDDVLVAPEADQLRRLLDWQRATLLHKCAGLDAEQLARTPLAFSNLSLLGLIRHMAKVERTWFRVLFRGEPLGTLYSTTEWRDADFEDIDPASARSDYDRLVEETDLARQAVAEAAMGDTFTFPDEDVASLRYVHLQMIAEYARHNGHADLLRQAIDGARGV